MIVQQAALHRAVFPHQRVAKLLPTGGLQHEGQVQALLDGGTQIHLLKGVGIPGPQGLDRGGVTLVLADDIGVIGLPLADQNSQLGDNLKVDGVFSAPHAFNILHIRGGSGAQLLDFAESQPLLLVKEQDGVLL